jgi:hypothetical protein
MEASDFGTLNRSLKESKSSLLTKTSSSAKTKKVSALELQESNIPKMEILYLEVVWMDPCKFLVLNQTFIGPK